MLMPKASHVAPCRSPNRSTAEGDKTVVRPQNSEAIKQRSDKTVVRPQNSEAIEQRSDKTAEGDRTPQAQNSLARSPKAKTNIKPKKN